MKTHDPIGLILLAGVATLVLTGCHTFDNVKSSHQSSSVVNYLYPNQANPVVQPAIPVLSLPLKVGVAFVPGDSGHAYAASGPLSESQKFALINEVSESFKKFPFVKSIEIIPSSYLTPRGSFANLDQIRSMYGVDVVALLSYDQVQFTDTGLLSLTYWTLVGAYVVKGEKNDTQTMLDAAVYDIRSRKLLFRAPGISRVKNSATPVNLTEKLRLDRDEGFRLAATELVTNLHRELELFRERVKKSPDEIKIAHQPGYAGGGSLGGWELALVAALAALQLRRRQAPRV